MDFAVRRITSLPVFVIGSLLLLLPTASAFGEDPATSDETPVVVRKTLSDEKTLTRWAHANSKRVIRSLPKNSATRIGNLRLDTEDGFPEVYLALRSYTGLDGKEWVKVRIPGRPNGRSGWVRREGLDGYHKVRTYLKVSRNTFTAILYKSGRRIWSSRIGHGARGTPTPGGHFYIRERIRNIGGSPNVAVTGTLRSPEANPGRTAFSTNRVAAALSSSERDRKVEP